MILMVGFDEAPETGVAGYWIGVVI